MKGPTSVPSGAALAILVALMATVGAAAATLPAAPAQQGIPRQPDLRDYRRLGPLFYSPALRVKALGYEDNVFLDQRNPEGDFRATFGPEVRGVVRFSDKAWVVLHGVVDFSGYAKHSSLNHFDGQSGIETTTWLGNLRVTTSYDSANILRRPSSEVDDRVRVKVKGGRLACLYEFTPDTTVEADVARAKERYGTAGGTDYDEALGHSDLLVSVTGRHRVGPSTWAAIDLSKVDRAGRDDGGLRDLRKAQVLMGLDFEPKARIRGSVRVGVGSVTTPGLARDDRQDFRGAAGRGDLELEAGSRNRVRLGFRRDFTFSTYMDNIYFRNDAAEVAWVRELTARVAAEAGLSRSWAVYPSQDPFRRRDRTMEPFLGARLRLGRQVVLAIRAGRWSRESNVDGEDRSRIVIDQNVSIPL